MVSHELTTPDDLGVTHGHSGQTDPRKPDDHRRFPEQATYFQLLGDGKAFLECVIAFVMSLGFQLKHKVTCRGSGCFTRHSHYARVRLGGIAIWRIQCTTCKAVFTVLPHFILRYRQALSN